MDSESETLECFYFETGSGSVGNTFVTETDKHCGSQQNILRQSSYTWVAMFICWIYVTKKCLQHLLYAFQNKSTPAFLLTESIILLEKGFLLWNICRSGRCMASYCIVPVFIWVHRTNFIQGNVIFVAVFKSKPMLKTLSCSSSSSAELIVEPRSALNRCCVNIVHWMVAQLPFFLYINVHTFSLYRNCKK